MMLHPHPRAHKKHLRWPSRVPDLPGVVVLLQLQLQLRVLLARICIAKRCCCCDGCGGCCDLDRDCPDASKCCGVGRSRWDMGTRYVVGARAVAGIEAEVATETETGAGAELWLGLRLRLVWLRAWLAASINVALLGTWTQA
jgi:hypothetical protein